MNIAFIYDDNSQTLSSYPRWRGWMFYNAIKKTSLHIVDILSSTNFSLNNHYALEACSDKQIIVIEGSFQIELLDTINFWKSRGKVVVVDIPLEANSRCRNSLPQTGDSYPLGGFYSIHSRAEFEVMDNTQKFRWGLHLADAILVSSPDQKEQWQSTAPVKIIPEYINLDLLRDLVKINHKEIVIGFLGEINNPQNDELLSIVSRICELYPNVQWLPLTEEQNKFSSLLPKSSKAELPVGTTNKWPHPLMLVDIGLIWSSQTLPGEKYRNILEFMALKIPWISNDIRGYQGINRYGLMAQTYNDWEKSITDLIVHLDDYNQECEKEPFLYAMSQNIDDHIHEILIILSEFWKGTE